MTIKGLEGSKEKIQDNMIFPTTSKLEKPALRGNSCTLLFFYIQQEYGTLGSVEHNILTKSSVFNYLREQEGRREKSIRGLT